mgnify:CR=1 FL=1
MKYIYNLLIIIVAVLTSAAGIAKVMLAAQELEFLQSFGFNNTFIIIFGVIQIMAGALLINKNSRLYGAGITGAGFFVSSMLIFTTGNVSFGVVSLLPVALTGGIFYKTAKSNKSP